MPDTPLTHSDRATLHQEGYRNIVADPLAGHPEIFNAVKRMALNGGIENPTIYLAEYPMPQVMAIAPNKIIVSQKTLNLLNDAELAAVIGREMEYALQGENHLWNSKLLVGGMVIGGLAKIALDNPPDEKTGRRTFLKAAGRGAMGAAIGAPATMVGGAITGVFKEGGRPTLVENLEALGSAMQKLQRWHEANPDQPQKTR